MNIALVTVLREDGKPLGAENLYDGLENARRAYGFDLQTFPMAIDESTWEGVLEGYLKCYDLDLEEFDAVISTKTPTFMLRHRYHISYLVHTMRVFYDMFDREFPSPSPRTFKQRELIHKFDNHGLSPKRVKKHFAIGSEVARRLKKWNKIDAVTVHPAPRLSGFHCEGFEYIFMPGRLHRWKRIDLMIRAMKHLKADVRLLIAGTGDEEDTLRELAGGDPRIEFLGYVDDDTMLKLYADSLVVPFLAKSEDFGYVTVEAMKSGKPVVTCADSGESLAFVRDGETGFIVPPDPEAVAEKISRFIADPGEAEKMGERGRESVRRVDWKHAVQQLLVDNIEGIKARSSPGYRKTRITVTDNQILTPPLGGGRIRILYLYKDLSLEYDVTYVGAYDYPGPEYRDLQITENFREIILPLTPTHFKLDNFLRKFVKNRIIIDVTIPLLMRFSPKFIEKVNRCAAESEIVIVSHPWVFPFIERSRDKLLVYDSHNCEYLLRKAILGDTLVGRLLVRLVKKTEGDLCREADIIIACSSSDKENYVELYQIPEEKIYVVPNGTPASEIEPATPSASAAARETLGLDDRTIVLFVASPYPPNTEAVEYIVDHLAPKLPDCLFAVVGGVKDSYLRESGKTDDDLPANVTLYGFVSADERNSLYAAADIAINPVFRGSGTNIKMLDFFAAGLPVISTPVGARGIDMETGVHGLIAEKEKFPEQIESLSKNDELRARLGSAARKLVEEKYDWKIISQQMLSFFNRAREKKKLTR